MCDVLGLTTPSKVSDRLDEDEKDVSPIHTLGGNQNVTIINENGLYNVILRSDKPQAKAFKKWITSEILPSNRKTGGHHQEEAYHSLERSVKLLSGGLAELRGILQQAVPQLPAPFVEYVKLIVPKVHYTATQLAAEYGLEAVSFNNQLLAKTIIIL